MLQNEIIFDLTYIEAFRTIEHRFWLQTSTSRIHHFHNQAFHNFTSNVHTKEQNQFLPFTLERFSDKTIN